MFGDKMNIMSLLKNAKNIEKMMSQAQEELEKIEITGEAGAGAVKVIMNAKHTIKSIIIIFAQKSFFFCSHSYGSFGASGGKRRDGGERSIFFRFDLKSILDSN